MFTVEKASCVFKMQRDQRASVFALRKPEIKPRQYFELAIELNRKFVMAYDLLI
jgi:hypothetical protein